MVDTPSAFAGTHAAEAAEPGRRWAELAAQRSTGSEHATFFAVDGCEVIGLVGGHRVDPATVDLVSMWTEPVARGRGVGAVLVDAMVAWADGSAVELWVTRGNDAAQRLCERCGFHPALEVQPLPSDPCRDEVRMRREAHLRAVDGDCGSGRGESLSKEFELNGPCGRAFAPERMPACGSIMSPRAGTTPTGVNGLGTTT